MRFPRRTRSPSISPRRQSREDGISRESRLTRGSRLSRAYRGERRYNDFPHKLHPSTALDPLVSAPPHSLPTPSYPRGTRSSCFTRVRGATGKALGKSRRLGSTRHFHIDSVVANAPRRTASSTSSLHPGAQDEIASSSSSIPRLSKSTGILFLWRAMRRRKKEYIYALRSVRLVGRNARKIPSMA